MTEGLSYMGATDLQASAWHWVKRKGIFLPRVWSAVSQLKAFAEGRVVYLIYNVKRVFGASSGTVITRAEPGIEATGEAFRLKLREVETES